MEELIEKVKSILAGIDIDDCSKDNYQDANGYDIAWWETSEGAKFGKAKLGDIIKAIEEAYNVV